MSLMTSELALDVLICVTIITLIVYMYMTRNFNYWKKRGVKEVRPSFFFGNAGPCIFTKQTPLDLLNELYKESNGEKMIGFHVFDQPYLMICDPELIRHIFIKDFSNFSNKLVSSNENDPLGSKSIFLIHNPPWKYIRQKLSPVFSTGKLKNMFYLMLEICEDLEEHLKNLEIDDKVGKTIEVKELCAKFTTDLIGLTAFGLKLNSLKDPEAEFRKYGRKIFDSTYKRYFQMLSMFFIPQLKFLTKPKFFDAKGTDFFRNSFWYAINERKKTGIRRNDIIDLIIDLSEAQDKDANDMYRLEGDHLVAQASIFFSGGFETSSSTMTFALYELARNPEIQQKLRDEIVNALDKNNGKFTFEMIMTLPLLHKVVREILRMYPILPWLDRKPETDYTLPGTDIIIAKGTPLILPMRMLHMDSKYFPDPEKFDPERFSDENKQNITPCTYFPFGEGPRNCIGSRMGYLQTQLGLAMFMKKYEVAISDKTMPMEFHKLNVMIQPSTGVYLNFRKISD